MADYHGPTPVTDEDKKMAKKHLDQTEDNIESQQDLLEDKIDDHKKALKKAIKNKNKKSADYNRKHLEDHEDDLREVNNEHSENRRSHRTLNDLRKAKVKVMAKKAGV